MDFITGVHWFCCTKVKYVGRGWFKASKGLCDCPVS